MKKIVDMLRYVKQKMMRGVRSEQGDVSVNYILLTAALIIVLAFVIVPQLRTFASDVLTSFETWSNTVNDEIFATPST